MTTRIRLLASALAPALLFACTGSDDAPPPLFNALDPSLSCPAGQVGWDFSTGGLDDIQRNAVGRAVKVIDATLAAGCGISASDLRARCDGQEECPVAMSCEDSDVNVTYVCGTETPVYKARVHGSGGDRKLNLVCGQPIIIKKAIYAPTAAQPLDITAAVAARCSGKRRCSNGIGAYELAAYQDPQPNVSKQVEIRYACGGEANEYLAVFEDAKLDFHCALEDRPVTFREPIHIVSAAVRLPTGGSHQSTVQSIVDLHLERIRAACEGKLSCEFTLDRPDSDPSRTAWYGYTRSPGTFGALGWEQKGQQQLIVRYTCGTGTHEVEKAYSLREGRGSLKCGETIAYDKTEQIIESCRTFSGVQQCSYTYQEVPELTKIMKARCDGRRVCYTPVYDGRTYDPGLTSGLPRFRAADGGFVNTARNRLRHKVTCGSFSPPSDIDLDHNERAAEGTMAGTSVECPVFDPGEVKRGIRIAEVSPVDQTLAITKRCYGTDTCDVGSATVKYRCGNSPTLQTSQAGKLECRPTATITGISGCAYLPPANYCQHQPGSCNYSPEYPSNIVGCSSITASYTCGQDPEVRTAVGTAVAPQTKVRRIVLDCPTRENPYVRKACIPTFCFGASRRDLNLACTADSRLQPTVSVQTGVIRAWQETADGGTSRFGAALPTPAGNVYPLVSETPYQVFTTAYYRADNAKPLPDNTTATTFAYDQFEFVDGGQPNPSVFGFRCLLAESPLKDAAVPSSVAGFQAAVMGGKGSSIPSVCFDQGGYNDERTSTYDAARSLKLEESTFRQRYRLKQSWVASAWDPHGRTSVVRKGALAYAPNPIGFFYDPKRDWVNWLGYYAERADFTRAYKVRFEPSKQIDLAAIDQTVDAPDLLIDVEKPELLPGFDVNLGWYQRGSSSLNPYFQETRVANNPVQTLARRNMRVTVEMARTDTGLSNPWEESNSVRFPSQPVSAGISIFRKTERVHVDFTPELRKRMLTVRGTPTTTTPAAANGFMSDFKDEDTVFLVRACLDVDGLERRIGDTSIDGVTLPKANEYDVKISKRCGEPRSVVVRRQLFVRPTTPTEAAERPNDKGAMASNGDRDVGGGNDNGAQVGCVKSCTVNADCGAGGTCTPGPNSTIGQCVRTETNTSCSTQNRTEQGSGGQFPLTLYSTRSNSSTAQNSSNQTQGAATASAEMFSFTTFAPSSASTTVQNSPTKTSLEVKISPNLQPIIDAWKGKKVGVFSTDAKKLRMAKKSGVARGESEAGQDGLGLAVSREFYIQIGPVPLVVEFSLSAGLGFELTLKSESKRSVAGQTSDYPCLNSTGTRCFSVESSAKNFADAQQACQVQGGRLAQVLTASDLTEINSQIDTAGGTVGSSELWLGGQAAYNYGYSPCATNGGRWYDGSTGPNGGFSDKCREASITGYFWLTGQRFAQQSGLSSTITQGSLANNGFPANSVTLAASPIPEKAAVTYRKNPFRVGARPLTDSLASVCVFDAATSVLTQSGSVGFSVSASVGMGAGICLPSNKVGVCLTASLQFVSVTLAVEAGNENTFVYSGAPGSRRLRSAFGKTTNQGEAEAAFLAGSLNMELRFLFWTKSFELKTFGPGYKKKWPLFENENKYFRETP